MFLLKKITGPLFDPLSICLVLVMIGLIMLWFTRKQGLGKAFMTVGFLFLILASYNWVSRPFIKPLETKYPALLKVDKASGAKWIVVLGSGVTADKRLPVNSQLSMSALARLVEGIRIHKALPHTRILLSGGLSSDNITEAEAMAGTAVSLGVDRQKLVLDSKTKDTEDQAELIKKIVGNEQFILVTTASHMPRSVALVKKLGLNPIPAPADYSVKEGGDRMGPGAFFPGSGNILIIELAMHEYLGMAWAKLRGRI